MGIMGIVKGLKRGVEGVKTAPGRAVDNYRLNEASKTMKSAINKTGGFFGAGSGLGDPRSRGYDDRVKQEQKRLLQETGKTIQGISERNRKRVERLNKLR
jgi:hypothetical protein